MNNLDRNLFTPTLLLVDGSNSFYPVENDVKIIDLKTQKTKTAIPKIIKAVNDLKPDFLFSTLTHLNILLAIAKFFLPVTTKLIARESSIASINNKYYKQARLNDFLMKVFYKKYDLIICQSQQMSDDLVSTYKMRRDKIKVINNPVSNFNIDHDQTKKKNEIPTFITVGRLSKEKGYDRILKSLSLLDIAFKYIIIGEGSERTNIENLVEHYDLSNQVQLLGLKKQPQKYLCVADLFLQGSHYEGFPNALLEATSCGVPVIAFDVPGGTSEIIQDEINGFLIEDDEVDDYAKNIKKALSFGFDNSKIKEITDTKFALNKIIKAYQNAILSA